MKKILTGFMAVLLCVSFISSCGAPKGADNANEKKITIKIGTWPGDNSPADQELNKKWKQAFEAKYPNIEIIPETYDYDAKTFIAKAESGQLPNMFSTWYTEPAKIVKAGYAADITDIVNEYGYDTKYDADIFNICKQNEKIYGLPRDMYKLGLWCNVNLFTAAGLVDEDGVPIFPKTFDEVAQTAKIITEKTGKNGMFIPSKDHNGGWHFNSLAWNFGAEMETEVDGKWQATFNSPEAVAALQYIKDLKWKYNVLSENALLGWTDFLKNFGTDQVAMVMGAIDQINQPVESYGMSKDNFSICSMPAGPGGKYSQIGGNVIMFSKNSTKEQIDACFKWLEMTDISPNPDPEGLKGLEDTLKIATETNKIVLAQSVSVWTDPAKIEGVKKVREKYTNVNPELTRDYFENKDVTIKAEAPYNCQDMYGLLDNVIQKILSDKNADPKTLLDQAAKEFQKDYLDSVNK